MGVCCKELDDDFSLPLALFPEFDVDIYTLCRLWDSGDALLEIMSKGSGDDDPSRECVSLLRRDFLGVGSDLLTGLLGGIAQAWLVV